MDSAILSVLNGLAGHDPTRDHVVYLVSNSYLFKGIVPLVMFWAFWARRDDQSPERHRLLVSAVAATIVTIVLVRILAFFLPFRPRPVHDPDAAINLAVGYSPPLADWSSFPSDHAGMFFDFATAFLWISKPAAIFLYLHAFLVVSLPRIYLGLHWPSDILGGAALGILLAVLIMPVARRALATRPAEALFARPMILVPLMILVTVELASMFTESRRWLGTAARLSGVID